MKIRILVGVTSLAALVTLTGIGCSSSDPETGDQDGGATTDSAAHDGAAQKDTSAPPQVDAGTDAEIVVDSSTPVDASDAASSDAAPADAGTADADAATTKDASTDGATTDAAAIDASSDASADAGSDAADANDGASSSDATITPDAGTHDAATDAKVFPPPDASDPDAALVCAPSDMSGFQPVWHPPVAHSASCSTAQMAAYHQCLMDSQTQGNPPSCAPFQGTTVSAADKACIQCITTQDTASSYGAIIIHKGTIEINVAGCISLATNDPQGTGCAGKVQASGACVNAACSATCAVVDEASFQLEQQCEQSAASGTCKPIADAATCIDGLVDAGGAAAACTSGQTFDDLYDAVVPLFCGP